MSTTPHLGIPLLAAGQSQKHVTLNEALLRLDSLVQISVLSRNLGLPPANPADGAAYLVPAGGSGNWAGHAGKLARFQDGHWEFFVPAEGWLVWLTDEALLLVHRSGAWNTLPVSAEQVARWGVNASPDDQNRLAVAAHSSLFTHDGTSHRISVNKASAADTASLVFQSGFSGRAEIGLPGSNGLTIKHSDDGANWTDIFRIESHLRSWLSGNAFEMVPASPYGLIRIAASLSGDRYSVLDFLASSSHPIYSARLVRYPGANGRLNFLNVGTGEMRLGTQDGGPVLLTISSIDRLRVDTGGNLTPELDNAYSLGKSGARFSAIWAANGVIQTSDARDKLLEGPIAARSACAMVEAVSPILFRWRTGSREAEEIGPAPQQPADSTGSLAPPEKEWRIVEHPGRRLHAGFLAQEIKSALDAAGLDFGAWGLEDSHDPESRQWLRPDQLLPIIWAALKETRAELRQIKSRLDKLSQA